MSDEKDHMEQVTLCHADVLDATYVIRGDPPRKIEIADLACDFCGQSPSPYLALGRTIGAAFCSDACRTAWLSDPVA